MPAKEGEVGFPGLKVIESPYVDRPYAYRSPPAPAIFGPGAFDTIPERPPFCNRFEIYHQYAIAPALTIPFIPDWPDFYYRPLLKELIHAKRRRRKKATLLRILSCIEARKPVRLSARRKLGNFILRSLGEKGRGFRHRVLTEIT